MTNFEKLKNEISGMSASRFVDLLKGTAFKDYICGDIKVPHAKCVGHNETYDCAECIIAYLESEATS